MVTIGEYAFSSCEKLSDVYYAGLEEQWNRISIAEHSGLPSDVRFHFNSETIPEPEPPDEQDTPITPTFADIPANAWFANSVAYVVDKGLFQGTSETSFSPNAPMTRAMLMTVLARLDGVDTTPAEGESWYAPGMEWAKNVGVSDGSNPNGPVTREQLATMLWRYTGEPETAGTLEGFTDVDKVSSYAETAMKWAVEKGIINGKGNNILDPKGNATRAEVATMLMRFCENQK